MEHHDEGSVMRIKRISNSLKAIFSDPIASFAFKFAWTMLALLCSRCDAQLLSEAALDNFEGRQALRLQH